MKRLFTLVCALFLGATLSLAQAGGGSTGTQKPGADKGATEGKKEHKGGKKSKKGAGDTGTTPPPK